jgi:A/G-specific adenine glycosylase
VTDSAHDHLPSARVRRIRRGLLDWFRGNARDLPWRNTRDPYAVLVSEVMLQQTQVDRVIPYYERFLKQFPTVQALAAAATADVIRLWSGLGYNRRAVNLQRAARAVVEAFGGTFPRDPADLRRLPGIGAYTAGAIAAFAYEEDVAFVDTNMRRVLSRVVFGGDEARDAEVLEVARTLLPPGQSWVWNQALIEFGALHCTARRPACVVCPLREDCAAYPVIQSALAVKRNAVAISSSERFEQSSRYYRGRIVQTLRTLPADDAAGLPLSLLGPTVRDGYTDADEPWLRSLVEGLQRDGLAVVAEEAGQYDANSPGAGEPRVRLP